MANADIPDDIALAALAVFRPGDQRDDAAAIACFEFLRMVETLAFKPAQAKEFLSREDAVREIIATTRAAAEAGAPIVNERLSSTRDDVLEAIRADMRQTLTVQQQMHSDVLRLNAAAERLEQASRQTEADTKLLSGMISTVMRKHLDAQRLRDRSGRRVPCRHSGQSRDQRHLRALSQCRCPQGQEAGIAGRCATGPCGGYRSPLAAGAGR